MRARCLQVIECLTVKLGQLFSLRFAQIAVRFYRLEFRLQGFRLDLGRQIVRRRWIGGEGGTEA